MKIGEVEELLGITRSNIRYYEKEGLLKVERGENKYRDYSDADISTLKRIIVLRKSGVSVDDIKSLFKNEKSLDTVLDASISTLQKDIDGVKDSLVIAKQLVDEAGEDFDGDYYFELITRGEREGKSFVDPTKDKGNIFDSTFKYLFGQDYREQLNRKSVKAVTIVLLTYMLLFVLIKVGVLGGQFAEIFTFPLTFLFSIAVIGFPILFVRKSYPSLADAYFKAVVVFEIVVTLFSLYVLAAAIINIFIL